MKKLIVVLALFSLSAHAADGFDFIQQLDAQEAASQPKTVQGKVNMVAVELDRSIKQLTGERYKSGVCANFIAELGDATGLADTKLPNLKDPYNRALVTRYLVGVRSLPTKASVCRNDFSELAMMGMKVHLQKASQHATDALKLLNGVN